MIKKTKIISDPRPDVGSMFLLLLDDLVSVTDVVKGELFSSGGQIIIWVRRKVFETGVSAIFHVVKTTLEIHWFTVLVQAKLAKLLTPLKHK